MHICSAFCFRMPHGIIQPVVLKRWLHFWKLTRSRIASFHISRAESHGIILAGASWRASTISAMRFASRPAVGGYTVQSGGGGWRISQAIWLSGNGNETRASPGSAAFLFWHFGGLSTYQEHACQEHACTVSRFAQ